VTLTELRYVSALAREQHFGRAAERCHVSQPTLSIGIKKLEDELGVPLFERAKNGVSTTPLGHSIASIADQILELTVQIKDVADADRDQLVGSLALGTLPTIGPYLLPQFIPLLQELAPGLTLYVEEANQTELGGKLRTGELDIALVCTPFVESDVVVQALFDEPFVLLLPANHRLCARDEIEPDDLDPKEVLLLREGHQFREQVLEAFPSLRLAQANLEANARSHLQGSTLETLRHMVASRLGITILPMAAAQIPLYSAKVLSMRSFKAPAPKRTLALAWRASFPRHKAIDTLRRAIQASSAAYWNYNTVNDQDRPVISLENREW
jgi:LysR family hydrogen peroxide-inducible transcriptional activator